MTFEIIGAYDKRFEEVDRIAKEFFSIDSDPTQIDANENTFLYSLEIGGILVSADNVSSGNILSYLTGHRKVIYLCPFSAIICNIKILKGK